MNPFLNIFLYFSKVRKREVDDAAKHKKKKGLKQPRNSRGNHYMRHVLLKDDKDLPYRFVCVCLFQFERGVCLFQFERGY